MGPDTERRYTHRRLADTERLSVREISERTGHSKSAVQRDLDQTVAPAGYTDRETPYYPPGRFDRDNEYVARVAQLRQDMPERNARLRAAKEFASIGAPKPRRKPPTEKQVAAMEAFAKARA